MKKIAKSKWKSGLPFKKKIYFLSVSLLMCGNAFATNTDSIIANGTERTIQESTFENGTNGAYIIQAKKGAVITARQVELNSSGTLGGGLWIENSQLNAQDLNINVAGSSGTGLYLANESTAILTNFNVYGTSSAIGMVLDGTWSVPQGHVSAEITDGTVATNEGDAFRITAGELTLKNITATTLGSSSYAVNANASANVKIDGGSFTTQGLYSDAIWVASADSSVTLNNASVSTAGNRASAINAQLGNAYATNSILKTQGENAYGLYTQKFIQGEALTITTAGTGSVGLFSALGGQGVLNNSIISTDGELAAGLAAWPGSAITADNVQIETTGMQAFGLWARAGSLAVSNSEISTSGEAASGLYADGYSSSLKSTVSLDKVTLTASQAPAIQAETTNLSLVAKDSTLTGGNGQLLSVANYVDTLDPASNLYSNVTFEAVNSRLNGNVDVTDPLNTVAVSLFSGTVLTGAVNNATSLSLDSTSQWNISNSSNVGQLTNNGTIIFFNTDSFNSLTITGDYAGDGGLLVMNSVLGDDASPTNTLIVGGDVLEGTTSVTINNLGGYGAQTVEGIEIVDVAGTSMGRFIKSGRIVAGAYDYDLIKKGESWYLTSQSTAEEADANRTVPEESIDVSSSPESQEKAVVHPEAGSDTTKPSAVVRPEAGSYTANLAAANTMFMMTLHDRLGETQFINAITGQPEVTSLWLRQIGGHNKWRDGSGQLKTQSNRYMTQIGGDVARWSTSGADRWHVGFMAGYGNNKSATESQASRYRSKGDIKGYSIGSYATWYANRDDHTGAWLDSWLLYSWFDNEVKGQNLAAETYKSHGFTASLESGYAWMVSEFQGSQGSVGQWFIEPQVQAVWMGVRADNHREENGTRIRGEGDGNWMTRLGVRTWLKGHHASDEGRQREFQPYFALNWLHNSRNFSTDMNEIRVSQKGAKNLGEVKVGLEGQLNPRLNLWGNIGVQVGDEGYNDAAALIGLKYNF